MTKNIIIKQIEYNSESYKLALDLRFKILREPLGLALSKQDLDGEDQQIHIVAIAQNEIVGTIVLKPITRIRIKLRQMAVSHKLQGQGIGKKLVVFAEELAKSQDYKIIEMIARLSALKFYQKLGYKTEGEEFEEVTVRSINMAKTIV